MVAASLASPIDVKRFSSMKQNVHCNPQKTSIRFKCRYKVLTYVKHIASRIVKQSSVSRDALWLGGCRVAISAAPPAAAFPHSGAAKNATERDGTAGSE